MRIAFEIDDYADIQDEPTSETVVVPEDRLPEVLRPPPNKPSRRPTRAFPMLTKETFLEHMTAVIGNAKTDDDRAKARSYIERGVAAGFISHENADELLLKLVAR